MRESEVKAVLFDLGETLLSFGRVPTKELFREGARLTYEYLKAEGQPVGNYFLYCLKHLIILRLRYWIANRTDRDFDSLKLLRRIGRRSGYDLNREQWEEICRLWYEPLSKLARIEPDIKETLAKLREAGLKLGIVSNTFINACCLDKQLAELGILDFFEFRVYSYQVEYAKPRPEIFRYAAEKIGEPLENIMFVGDRVDNDVTPAMKLGMTPVFKRSELNGWMKVPAGVRRVENLSELPELITQINS